MSIAKSVKILSAELASDLDVEVGTVVVALKASDCFTDGETWYAEDGTPMEWSIYVAGDEAWFFATADDVEVVE
jgi:hypothetical protein